MVRSNVPMKRPKPQVRLAGVVALVCCALLGLSTVAHLMAGESLIDAAGRGDANEVKKLLESHADPNARDLDLGITPLMSGAENGNERIVQLLLAHGADANESDYGGRGVLSYAAEGGSRQMVALLIGYGAKIDARDRRGRTPLMWAAARNSTEAVETLISYGADPDARDNEGRTALDIALFRHSRSAVGILRGVGAPL